jgi:urease beta subunit
MKKTNLTFITVFLTIALAGFSVNAAPIYNVTDHPVSVSTHHLSQSKIANVIIGVGLKRGWKMQKTSSSTIRARLDLRSHVAVVDIQFNKKVYNITYNSSKNLKYREGNIHRNYNKWIKNLENDIALALHEAATR